MKRHLPAALNSLSNQVQVKVFQKLNTIKLLEPKLTIIIHLFKIFPRALNAMIYLYMYKLNRQPARVSFTMIHKNFSSRITTGYSESSISNWHVKIC